VFAIEDKAARFRHCVTDQGDGSVRVDQDRSGVPRTWFWRGALPDGPVRVIFQDDNYNAPKSPPQAAVAEPFTWHWDNVEIG
jgi:hypothetical protein